MGFNASKTIVKGAKNKDKAPSTSTIDLTEKELEFLLVTIKNSLFKGADVEICYNTTLKIQDGYTKIKDKKL